MIELRRGAAEAAKAAGLASLKEVSEMTGTSTQTLNNWHRDKPQLFAVVLRGCLAIKLGQLLDNRR